MSNDTEKKLSDTELQIDETNAAEPEDITAAAEGAAAAVVDPYAGLSEKERIKKQEKAEFWKKFRNQKTLIILSIPFVIYVIIFCYIPLVGWLMAFQNYKAKDGLFGSEFVGLKWFEKLFSNEIFLGVIRNTLAMGVINLVLSTVFAIGFAIILNEVRQKHVKKVIQTISYMPHFLSWIIVTGIVFDVLSADSASPGIVNQLLMSLGLIEKPILFLAETQYFWWIVGFSNVWKETGWNSIIYLAAITAINTDLYEAASIDGAGRLRKIWHVTLPGLKPTILILLIMNVGNVLNAGFEVQYILGNGLVQSVSQTIDIYVLKYGISQNNFALGTAAGIFKSVVSIILIVAANQVAKRMGEEHLF